MVAPCVTGFVCVSFCSSTVIEPLGPKLDVRVVVVLLTSPCTAGDPFGAVVLPVSWPVAAAAGLAAVPVVAGGALALGDAPVGLPAGVVPVAGAADGGVGVAPVPCPFCAWDEDGGDVPGDGCDGVVLLGVSAVGVEADGLLPVPVALVDVVPVGVLGGTAATGPVAPPVTSSTRPFAHALTRPSQVVAASR